MSEILNSLLKKEVAVDDVVKWLSYKDIKDEAQNIFKNFENKRVEFLPYFLNYLRDQTSNIVHNSQSSGFTPKKPLQLNDTRNSNHNVEPYCRNVRQTPRIKLFPSSTEQPNSNTGQNNKVSFGAKNKRHSQLISNNSSVKNYNARLDFRPAPKLCLGQFLTSDLIANTQKRKTIQPIAVQKENARYSENIFKGSAYNEININDFELFPPFDGISRKKKENVKRIVPASLTSKTNLFEQFGNQNYIKKENMSVSKRNLNKSESNKSTGSDSDKEATVNCSSVMNFQSVSIVEIAHASAKDVTFQNELDIMGNLYSSLIDENLIPNISVELYFIIQLLTVRNEPAISVSCDEKKQFFQTVHNCVYFSVKVLTLQKRILNILDKTTLKLLINNSRIGSFSSDLKTYLIKICETQDDMKNNAFFSTIGSVSFQSDTDNRNNFPDDQTFHVFRKQRDLFYEILREWEANHLNPSWSMNVNQGEKIRNVVNAWPNPSVYSHLARLFLNQLIATCKGEIIQDKNDNSAVDSELSNLKCKNPEKFERLQKRFVEPFHSGGPSPTPSFTGPEEFFSQFILLANCPAFNQYLIDHLVFQTIQLNSVELNISETDNCCTHVEDAVKQKFISSLTTLRVLAKFLGFMVFSPYKSADRFPQDLKRDSIIMRNKIPLVLNLKSILIDAIKKHRLILTIPWIIEFLSMMDAVAVLLDNIQEILIIFSHFYRTSLLEIKHNKFNLNYFFILLLLGWLFEIHNVSFDIFFTALNESLIDYHISDTCFCLDSMQLIDHRILYACCPYLGELKVVLGDFAAGMNNRSSSIKKIIPISADHQEKSSLAEKHLQLQLEENFFHNHSQSLKKTVEFVSERMASNVIKHLKKDIIPVVRKESFAKLYKYFLEILKIKGKIKANFTLIIQEVSSEMCTSIKSRSYEFMESYCKERVGNTLKLLSEDISASVVDICTLIASRWTKEKVLHWIATYVTPGLFSEELQTEIEKYKKLNVSTKGNMPEIFNAVPNQNNISTIAYASFSPTDILIHIKSQLKKMYIDKMECTSTEINETIRNLELLLQPIMDVTLSVKKLLLQLLLEFIMALIIIQPSILKKINFYQCLQNCQKNHEANNITTSEIVCSRNLTLLMTSSNSKESWVSFQYFLTVLLKENVLKPELFERQCISSLKQEWPEDFLQLFIRCINGVLKDRKVRKCREFGDLKEWLYKKQPSYQEYDLPRI